VASLLSLPTDRYPPLALSPQKQKEETLRLLADSVAALASDTMVLLIFEDAHWIDPTSQELLDLIVPMTAGHPVFAVITYRPEYAPPWLGQGHVTPLALQRLGKVEAAAMVAQVSDEAISDEVLAEIVAKTDGVPLFVEELTKTVAEGGEAGVPETLQDSLMARLDRLGPAKEVAQVGACIGREFAPELLAMVSPLDNAALGKFLRKLAENELIFRAGSNFVFKHALVQDVAYDSLLKSNRQTWHRDIAKAIEDRFPEIATSQPEVLARHFAEAGVEAKALRYWLEAGGLAATRSANNEAVGHLRKGLALLSAMPETEQAQRTELDAQITLGNCLMATKGYTDPETAKVYERAESLCHALNDMVALAPVLYGAFAYYYCRSELTKAVDAASRGVDVSERNQDLAGMLTSHRALGAAYLSQGRLSDAMREFDQAVDLLDADFDPADALKFGQDSKPLTCTYKSFTCWLTGRVSEAHCFTNLAFDRLRETDHVYTKIVGLWLANEVFIFLQLPEKARATAQEVVTLAQAQGSRLLEALACIHLGWAEGSMGEIDRGCQLMQDGIDTIQEIDYLQRLAFYRGALAELFVRSGNIEAAMSQLRLAFALVETNGEEWCMPELYRIRGEAEWRSRLGDAAEAERYLAHALSKARDLGAKSWELRAAASLARLWQSQGKTAQARDLLAPVYGWFTEGFNTHDLIEAKALLDELA